MHNIMRGHLYSSMKVLFTTKETFKTQEIVFKLKIEQESSCFNLQLFVQPTAPFNHTKPFIK